MSHDRPATALGRPPRSAPRRAGGWARAGAVALLLWGAGQGLPAWAQLPSVLMSATKARAASAGPPGPAASTPGADLLARLQGEIKAEKQAQERLAQQPESVEVDERRRSGMRLLTLLAAQTQRLQSAAPPPQSSPKALVIDPALSGAGPFPVTVVDVLRDQLDNMREQHKSLSTTLQAMDKELEQWLADKRKADETVRRRQELLERGRDGADAQALAAALDQARVQARVLALELARVDEARRQSRQRRDELDAPIDQMHKLLERVRPAQVIREEDLSAMREGVASRRAALDAERTALVSRLKSLDSDGRFDPVTQHNLQDALRGTLIGLDELSMVEAGLPDAWRYRQKAMEALGNPVQSRQAAEGLREGLQVVRQRLQSLAERRDLLKSDWRVQQSRLAVTEPQVAEQSGNAQAFEVLTAQIAMLDRAEAALLRVQLLLQRTLSDLPSEDERLKPRDWLDEQAQALKAALVQFWQLELFSATESTQVDGRAVTVDYGVTVGKSVGVVALFVLGYFIAGWLSRRLSELLVRRMQISEQSANVVRRWMTSLLLLVVLLVVLKLARVPLTAFAFLGGALAIGVGFGAQNVIKNLISGVIILSERKVRVGDIITIGGMSGRVMAVDLRATTVRGFDGIDAIVPNSTLLENQVSNWSGGSPLVRRVVEVGVAYGSDLDQVCALITEVAREHKGVLAIPASEVFLQNFGDDALLFRLQYWMALDAPKSGPTIDSDLRMGMARAFSTHGIDIAFPQRVVHLNAGGPVRVELSPPSPATTADPAPPP